MALVRCGAGIEYLYGSLWKWRLVLVLVPERLYYNPVMEPRVRVAMHDKHCLTYRGCVAILEFLPSVQPSWGGGAVDCLLGVRMNEREVQYFSIVLWVRVK